MLAFYDKLHIQKNYKFRYTFLIFKGEENQKINNTQQKLLKFKSKNFLYIRQVW